MQDKARHTAIASAELPRATGTTVALLRALPTRLGNPAAGTDPFAARGGRSPEALARVAAAASTDMARPLPAAAAAAGASSYVGEVDALRGIAMSAVIAIHCGLLPFGWMGVWLFFVISGFSVMTSILAGSASASPGWKMVWRFYVRRALRIWPLYFGFIAANVGVLVWLEKLGPLQELPYLLSFTYNLKMIVTVYTPHLQWAAFDHLWTLAIEQQFYLVFPLALLLGGRRARGLALFATILLAPVIRAAVAQWAVAAQYDPLRVAFAVYAFGPAHFDAFAIGAIIALFRPEITRSRSLVTVAAVLAALTAIAYAGYYLHMGVSQAGFASVDAYRNIVSGILSGDGREIWVYFVPTTAGAALLIGILARNPVCLGLCRLPGLQAIGRISYGGYVLHVPVLMVLGPLADRAAAPFHGAAAIPSHIGLFLCAYPVTLALAWISYHGFEKRFQRLGRR